MSTHPLTDADRKRIHALLDLLVAHTTLADPSDSQGASWVEAEAVRLARQYGFDQPETVGLYLAERIL